MLQCWAHRGHINPDGLKIQGTPLLIRWMMLIARLSVWDVPSLPHWGRHNEWCLETDRGWLWSHRPLGLETFNHRTPVWFVLKGP